MKQRTNQLVAAGTAAAGTLSPQQVHLVTEYIDAHLSGRLSVSDLAGWSIFMRSFKQGLACRHISS
ncbi:MAG: hypothetical protein K2Y27_21790 [Xanthobacteraceae bacterium]|nr:hypothetical protein [Xanthobacteraceae bacterium]